MKVLLLNGSPKKDGCTKRALEEIITILNKEDIDIELIDVGNRDERGCIACHHCKKDNKCVFNDIVNELAIKFEKADGIIIGSPVYYASINGTIKSLLDRLFYSSHFSKSMKVGAAIVSSRRAGSTSAIDQINKYFTISNMIVASSSYWNEVHGSNKIDVEKDLEGLQTMRNLAKNIAFIIKSINLGKEKYGLPQIEKDYHTNFSDGL